MWAEKVSGVCVCEPDSMISLIFVVAFSSGMKSSDLPVLPDTAFVWNVLATGASNSSMLANSRTSMAWDSLSVVLDQVYTLAVVIQVMGIALSHHLSCTLGVFG